MAAATAASQHNATTNVTFPAHPPPFSAAANSLILEEHNNTNFIFSGPFDFNPQDQFPILNPQEFTTSHFPVLNYGFYQHPQENQMEEFHASNIGQ